MSLRDKPPDRRQESPRFLPHSRWQLNHLFLLVGENPLPNAVAAIALLHPSGIPYLVHSRLTQIQAERIAAVLAEFPALKPAQWIDLGDNQAEAYWIREKIQAVAASLTGSVGMNYTAGTKAIALLLFPSPCGDLRVSDA